LELAGEAVVVQGDPCVYSTASLEAGFEPEGDFKSGTVLQGSLWIGSTGTSTLKIGEVVIEEPVEKPKKAPKKK
jgi:hypothetical protein